MHVTAIIAAGGRGQRFGGAQPKQLLDVAGRTILQRSIDAFDEHPRIDAIVVAAPPEWTAQPHRYIRTGTKPLTMIGGGDDRQASVANAFDAVQASTDIVLVHDAARPFVSAGAIDRVIDAAVETGAAIVAVPARDTVKHARLDGRVPFIDGTLPRERIYLAQTPQAFRYDVLWEAISLGRQGRTATDEAMLVEASGHAVRLVEGDATNIKITTPEDVVIAEAIAAIGTQSALNNPQSAISRVGTGYDLHRLVDGRPLVVGGVTITAERGALGHSDADVVCHAATDAILGAACLGDIGRHFPDSDPRWKDASSIDLLARASALVREHGFAVANVDITVILERPKIKDYVAAMRAAVAKAIGLEDGAVSIKGKTNEGVDAVGRGEAIAAHAVALLRRSQPSAISHQP
jgi:2-C-methyl-D-erythritol 4-phosphate cytidylyltransferase/2-C-methyl-D-erythritol 2,4-cyclodiphosphate synthase